MRRSAVAVLVAVAVAVSLVGAPARPAAARPAASSADKWAVLIGIDRFKGRTRPNIGAAGDARVMREALMGAGFPSDHIVLLTDGAATQANIRSAMQWLVDHSDSSSFSVFHYSGHVKQMGGDRDHDGEKVDEYLWPHDNKLIADSELASSMRQLRGWAWINISGCEAAGLDDGINSRRHVFTGSSRENEKSYEFPSWKNSVFTGLVVRQGILGGMADLDENGHISLQEAFRYAAAQAPAMTRKQRRGAQHPYIGGGDGAEWYLHTVAAGRASADGGDEQVQPAEPDQSSGGSSDAGSGSGGDSGDSGASCGSVLCRG